MPVSMDDVAVAAGVSLSTVSRALAESPRVKLETRRHIQRLAREMGYLPNKIAQGLATKRTYTLGVVVMDIADPFVAEMVRAIDKTALDYGYSLILSNCGADPHRELAAITALHQQRVDGIIVPDPYLTDSSLPLLEEMGVPVILVSRRGYRYSVGTDHVAAGREAVNYLLDLGHERIAYISGTWARDESQERQSGYEQALLARGISPELTVVIERDAWPEVGSQGLERLLNLPQLPSAVFCFNDLTALGVIGAAHAAGLRVPDDLSVIGYDDISLAPHLTPPLTTMAQQKEQISKRAIELVLNLIDNQEPSARALLPAKLIVRGSTGPPRQNL